MSNDNSQDETKFYQENKDFIKSINQQEISDNFPLFITRQELVRYLVRYELFKKIINVKGSIVECGVYKGAALMFLAKLSAAYEPYALHREIIGFDTFAGFPKVDKKDGHFAKTGGMSGVNLEAIKRSVELYDKNRPIGHMPKVKLIKGDAIKTIPKFLKENSHTLVAMLYLDFDLYEPTKVALEEFLPRMPKGAIIAFDELNESRWAGETVALLEFLNINKYEIKKFSEEPHISYIRL